MSPRAVSPFTVDSFEGDAIDEVGGVALGRARITKTFTGALVGTGSVHMTTSVNETAAARAYVALERITGALDGRDGTFVLRHDATDVGGVQQLSLAVVPESGTGALAGISGTGEIAIAPDGAHTFTLDYELPGA